MALADMLTDAGFDCLFYLNNPEDKLASIIERKVKCEQFVAETPAEEINWLASQLISSDILVMDGYRFDNDFQRSVKPLVHKTVCIDDLARFVFHTDVVINHGNEAISSLYRIDAGCTLLLGPKYAILRKQFRQAARLPQRQIKRIDSVFICMGGADPFNITNKVLRSIKTNDFIKHVHVVIGAAFAFGEELKEVVTDLRAGKNVVVKESIESEEMISSIQQCQLAICPASSISIEVLAVRCGMLTGTVADNQLFVERMLIDTGCARSVGDFSAIGIDELSTAINSMENIPLVSDQLQKQGVIVDGLSAERLVAIFNKLSC
jgi:UDP-2,4-diacetamido-2,4,6-trideoxy-beta-L-altropyranose hydrolase